MNLEILQTFIAVPIVVAGAGIAALIRRRASALLPSLIAFAVGCALIGAASFAFAESLSLDATTQRSLFIAAKLGAAVGLLFIFNASGLGTSRNREFSAKRTYR